MEDLKKRKTMRLYGADYNNAGGYFITVCTQNKRCILSRVVGTGVLDGPRSATNSKAPHITVGTGVLDGPRVELLPYGRIVDKYINQLNAFYDDISIDAYVIMPNHIHLLLVVKENGPSGTPVPTLQNSTVSRFISTFKRFCNKECGGNIWQYRSHDHIIRSREDYEEHLKYIFENPVRWQYDELYVTE